MLVAQPRNAGRCIYCAFRTRQLALQARRLKSTNTSKHINPNAPNFTYYKSGERLERPERGRGHAGRTSEGHFVRKFFGKEPDEFAGRGAKKANAKENYNDVLIKRLHDLKEELKDAPLLEQLRKEKQDDGEKAASFSKVWKSFTQKIAVGPDEADTTPWVGKDAMDSAKTTRSELREAYRTRGARALDDRIKYAFYGHVTGSRFTESDIRNQVALADLRYPTEWYPATRSMQRSIHLHIGPTNSGKTYQALQRLEAAERGVYAGPLRLLAHEVYTRMNAKGKPCNLITGEERRSPENNRMLGNADMSACTVEMMPLNKNLDVAVIDEIQMIGNAERGWAWTQALLGVKAKEVHLCGEERTVPLIRELCASVGEKLEVHRYERLSPLKLADRSLDNDLRRLRKGDCIVSFSVMSIHALRRQIERQTGKKVATVYGSLPPETRAQQARLFNDPHNDYDFLVASDAVGMGLNLAIKRIIFEASSKFDGYQRRTLGIADIKQIAGRAGRYRTAEQATQTPADLQDLAAAKGDSPVEVVGEDGKIAESVGLVTTLEKFDFPIVAAAMSAEPEPIKTAGLYPPGSVLERFASYFPPGTPFSYILTRLHELSQMHGRFHLCGLKEQIWVADLIEPVKGLTVTDRNVICSAPCSKNDDMWKTLMPAYATCIAEQTGGDILDIEALPLEVLDAEVSPSRDYLRELERLHKGIVTYLWLSYRFAGIFTTRALAFHVKGLVEEKIEDVLSKFSFSESMRRKMAEQRQKQLLRDMSDTAALEGEGVAVKQNGSERVFDLSKRALDPEKDGSESDMLGADRETELERQTSLTAGGDRFGGEDDLELEEQLNAEVEQEQPAANNFVQWRKQQTTPATREEDVDTTISEAFNDGEDTATAASVDGQVEIVSDEQPSIAHAAANADAAEVHSVTTSQVTSSEQDTSSLESAITPEMELHEDQLPMEKQEVSPHPVEDRPIDVSPTTPQPEPEPNQFGGGIPPKHLAHLDVNATELERNAASRP